MELKQVFSKCLNIDYQYQHTYDVSIQRAKLRRQIVRARRRDIIHYYCWNWMELKQVFSKCLNTGYQYQHTYDVQDESHFHLKLTKKNQLSFCKLEKFETPKRILLQAVKTQMKCHGTRHFIWSCTVG